MYGHNLYGVAGFHAVLNALYVDVGAVIAERLVLKAVELVYEPGCVLVVCIGFAREFKEHFVFFF